jgi:hypothetical protein
MWSELSVAVAVDAKQRKTPAKKMGGHTVGVHSFVVARNLVWCGTGNHSIDTYTASSVRP